jgi:sirohydrochlorin ferrochelatase
MLKRALVAVAHGSADPRAAAAIGELMPLVARRAADRGLSVPDLRVAYLGHAAPSVPQVMRTFGPDTQVTVLPLLLTAAYHSKTDIPRVLARAGTARLNVTYGAPLGPHPLLLRALERRLPEAAFEDPAETGMVLAAAGSSDPGANATIAGLAAQWQAAAGWFAVRPAYASAVSPAAAGGQGSTAAAGGQGRTRQHRACAGGDGAAAGRSPPGGGGQLPACAGPVRRPDPGRFAGRGGGRGVTGTWRRTGGGRHRPGSVPGSGVAGAGSGVKLGKTLDSPRCYRGFQTRSLRSGNVRPSGHARTR